MKFESKFGVGEIVCTPRFMRPDRTIEDIVMRVVVVSFGLEGTPTYLCRLPHGPVYAFFESELIGDPEFDHDAGGYLDRGNGG